MYSIAIIGAGNIASGYDTPNTEKILSHAHAITNDARFKLKGFYDTDREKSETASRKWNTVFFDSVEELLEGVDVCVCCVPDRFHAMVIEQAVRFAPRVIITEKPIASSRSDLERIMKLRREKCAIAVNYSRRYIPEYQTLKSSLPQFGRLIKGVAHYGKGTMHNGSHLIDLLSFLFGNIVSTQKIGVKVDDYENDPTVDAIISWKDASVYLIGVDSRIVTVFELDLFFEKARIRLLDGGQRIELYKRTESKDYKGYYGYELDKIIKVDYSGALVGLYNNIHGYLEVKERLICGLDEGKNVFEICEKIRGYE